MLLPRSAEAASHGPLRGHLPELISVVAFFAPAALLAAALPYIFVDITFSRNQSFLLNGISFVVRGGGGGGRRRFFVQYYSTETFWKFFPRLTSKNASKKNSPQAAKEMAHVNAIS